MEALIKNIKDRLSTDNLVEMMKDAKLIDEERIKEEDVRKTLEKVDTNHLIDVDELAEKLKEITEKVARPEQNNITIIGNARTSFFSVLGKAKEVTQDTKTTDDDAYIKDNVTGFLD